VKLYHSLIAAGAIAATGLALTGAAQARDQIRIVGSSTVYPFTTTVAEQFGKASATKTPVVESTGTGGGMKLFCAGVGESHPDATNASRTLLFDIHRGVWSAELLDLFKVPQAVLPEVRDCAADFGVTEKSILGAAIPIPGNGGKDFWGNPVRPDGPTCIGVQESLAAGKAQLRSDKQ